jgi:hypothetical protein
MPGMVTLEENGYVIHYTYTDPWTMEDWSEVNQQSQAFYDQASHRLHVLLDVSRTRTVPAGIMRSRSTLDISHPNSGNIAIIGAAPMLKTIGEAILRLARFKRAKFFEKEEDARTYLREMISEDTKQPSPQA